MPICTDCKETYPQERAVLNYTTCLTCGEAQAKRVVHTTVPLHKSNYMVVTDRNELKGINNKGGFFR